MSDVSPDDLAARLRGWAEALNGAAAIAQADEAAEVGPVAADLIDALSADVARLTAEREVGMECFCGLHMTRNPHPDAGVPATVTKVGAVFVCIPCTMNALDGWATRAHRAERERDEALARVAERDATIERLLYALGQVSLCSKPDRCLLCGDIVDVVLADTAPTPETRPQDPTEEP